MQHSESRPSIEVFPRPHSAEGDSSALWIAFAVGIVGIALALTYALAQVIVTSWVFVG